ncbi:MAG TPA: alpha/beta hydrolase [Polyangiaceae bacterium]|nr:alpha/beta hydrolase [Polyangiaceae bacterium]
MPSFVDANGVRFAYLEEGAGPLVLLLHGFPDTPQTWDAVRPAVAALGYRAVTPFLRGYFPTAIPTDGAYDADTLGRDVLALIEALGAERAIVVGHDWGAAAGYAAAALGPERLARLVTVGIPHPASVRPSPRLLWTVRHFFTLKLPWAAARARANDFAEIDALWRRWSPAWRVPPGETDAVKEVFRHPGSLNAALGYYRALRPTLPASHRKRIAVPTVSFAGTDDNVDPAMFDRAASWFTGGYEVVRVPGGHFMHREHPGAFLAELTRKLGKAAG